MSWTTDSTPSDNSLSPLMDDIKVDDDIIITSPNKTRTTEDLFAMIHRCCTFCIGTQCIRFCLQYLCNASICQILEAIQLIQVHSLYVYAIPVSIHPLYNS